MHAECSCSVIRARTTRPFCVASTRALTRALPCMVTITTRVSAVSTTIPIISPTISSTRVVPRSSLATAAGVTSILPRSLPTS